MRDGVTISTFELFKLFPDHEQIPALLYRAKDAGYSVSVLRPSEPIGQPGQIL